jgi:hypothetical protein
MLFSMMAQGGKHMEQAIGIAGVSFDTVIRGTEVVVFHGLDPTGIAPAVRVDPKAQGIGNDYIKLVAESINQTSESNCHAELKESRDGSLYAVVTRTDPANTSARDVEAAVRDLLHTYADKDGQRREGRVQRAMSERPASYLERVRPRAERSGGSEQVERFERALDYVRGLQAEALSTPERIAGAMARFAESEIERGVSRGR